MPHLRGRITSVIFRDERTGTTLARLAPEGPNPKRLSYAFSGTIVFPLSVGEVLSLAGEWDMDPRYGKLLRVSRLERVPPRTRDGEAALLASQVTGLSREKANRLLEHFGSLDALADVCREAPDRLAEVLGRSRTLKARLASLTWCRQEIDPELLSALRSADLKGHQVQRLVSFFGAAALRRVVQTTPYDLCQVPGMGFRTADRLAAFYARGQGRTHDVLEMDRLLYGLRDAVTRQRVHGHTCAPEREVLRDAARLMEIPATAKARSRLKAALTEALKRRLIIQEFGQLYARGMHRAESDLALRIAKLMAAGARALSAAPEQLREWLADASLSEEQRNAVITLATSPVSLLVGGPGRGKTYTLRALVDLLAAQQRTILLLAPTGKAAKRVEEMTGRPCSTIHRACGLDWRPTEDERKNGRQRQVRRIEADVVIVDEASMLDLELALELVRRIRPGKTALVLVGDPAQLPPVSAGQVLRDLLDADVVLTARLTEVHRQKGNTLLLEGADAIYRGQMPAFADAGYEARLFDPSTCVRHPGGTGEDALRFEADTVQRWLVQAIARYSRDLGMDPRRIQVYAPQRTGPLGLRALNALLQQMLNPGTGPSARIGEGFDARAGDKVLQVRNNYRATSMDTRPADAEPLAVMNGQVGVVERVRGGEVVVRFEGVPCPIVYRTAEERAQLAPAYAMSVHRSQGSEVDVAFLVLPSGANGRLQNRHLVYTAWTRAKVGVAVFATRATLARAVRSLEGAERRSNLDRRLKALCTPKARPTKERKLLATRAFGAAFAAPRLSTPAQVALPLAG